MFLFLIIVTIYTFATLFIDIQDEKLTSEGSIRELPTMPMIFHRTFLSMILHMVIDRDFRNGLELMKYANNHPWKFDSATTAFSMGLLQFCFAVFTEFISGQVILASSTYLDVVKDFTALFVINEFDNYMYDYLPSDERKELIDKGCIEVDSIKLTLEDLFKIETTSSFKIGKNEQNNDERTLNPIYEREQ